MIYLIISENIPVKMKLVTKLIKLFIILIPIIVTVHYFFHPKNSSKTHTKLKKFNQKFRRKVLIAAEYRGGSTFTGELFNKNKEATYLFEILYMARRYSSVNEKLRKQKSIEILLEYFNNCNYPSVKKYILEAEFYKKQNPWIEKLLQNEGKKVSSLPKDDVDAKLCTKGDTCFLDHNDVLKGIYGNDSSPTPTWKLKKEFSNFCKSNTITAAKVIRIYHLKTLEPLQNLPDFYLIYIIRDPRAMFNSRLSAVADYSKTPYKWAQDNIRKQCSMMKQNLRYLKSSEADWLTKYDKLLIIRYEDLALYPERFIDKIYQFIDTDVGLEALKDRFLSLTEGKISKKVRKKRGIIKNQKNLNPQEKVESQKNRYQTSDRNSKQVIYKWMKTLSWDHVKEIQESCGRGILNAFGYRYFESNLAYQLSIDKMDWKHAPLLKEWDFGSNSFDHHDDGFLK